MTDTFIKPEHIQGSPEWLSHRQNYLGASDAAIVMGLSPWTTPYQLWERKLGLAPEQEETWQMRRGTEMEPVALSAFEDETGLECYPQVVYHKDHDFLMASLDGLTLEQLYAVEIKCPGAKAHETALSGQVPEYYMPQLQHQLACLGHEMIWYYSFDGKKGVALQVERDESFIERMIEAETEFWDCVQSKTPPPMTNKDYEDRTSPTRISYAYKLAAIDRQMKSLEEEKKTIRGLLIEDADGKSTSGGGVMITRTFPKGRVDYSAIRELEGVDLDPYRRPSKETWTMRLSRERETVGALQ